MKFTSFLAIAVTLTAVIAAPIADSFDAEPQLAELNVREADLAEPAAEFDVRAADDEFSPFDDELSDTIQARALTRGQCKKACDKGADAVEAFCRRLPKLDLRTRAACWAASTAAQSPLGQRACIAFCDAWF
jgi:hypothetical protein